MNYYFQYKADLFEGKCGEKDAITFLAGFIASQISRVLFDVRH